MKYTHVICALVIAAIGVSGCGNATQISQSHTPKTVKATEKKIGGAPGLLMVAHGSPATKWNKSLFELEERVKASLRKAGDPFHASKLVFMEFAKPTIADGVAEMEAAGCDRIVVVPLLIAPSSHSHWDIPSLLGLYTDERMEASLKAEGATPVHSRLPITITSTMDQADLFEEVMLRRIEAMSKDPATESLVVLAHGDEGLEPIWGDRMRKLVTYLCGKTGISYGDYAFVHVGQTYGTHGAPVIAKAAEERPRVLVVGCYLSMGVSRMHKRHMESKKTMMAMMMPNPLEGKEINVAEQGLLPDPMVAEWVVETAMQAIGEEMPPAGNAHASAVR